jgi:hypothetical protein
MCQLQVGFAPYHYPIATKHASFIGPATQMFWGHAHFGARTMSLKSPLSYTRHTSKQEWASKDLLRHTTLEGV